MKLPVGLSVICLLYSACSSAESMAQHEGWAVYTGFDSFTYSDAYSVRGLLKKLDGAVEAGERAFTFNRLDVGLEKGPWQLGLSVRYDYFLEFSEDASLFAYQEERGLPLTAGKHYQMDIDIVHFQGQGLFAAYRWEPDQHLWLQPRISLLTGDKLRDGTISGDTLVATGTAGSSGLLADYYYSQDILFDRKVSEAPTAKGITADLAVHWQVSPAFLIEMQVQDLFSYIEWQNAPRTVARASTDNVSLEPDGTLNTTALLSWTESSETFTQRLPVRTTLTGYWAWSDEVSAFAEIFAVGDTRMPRLGAKWRFSDAYMMGLYDFTSGALGVGAGYKGLSFFIYGDNTDLYQAHSLGVTLSAKLSF
ncbi:MAG: hypothetical protein ACPGF7_07125 [Pontibacterium sp.]